MYWKGGDRDKYKVGMLITNFIIQKIIVKKVTPWTINSSSMLLNSTFGDLKFFLNEKNHPEI